jgi:hypothetical protein
MEDDDIEYEDERETVQYTEGERHLFAEVVPGNPSTLHTWFARRWASPKDVPLSDAEFAQVVERLVEFLVARGLGPVTIDHSAPGK